MVFEDIITEKTPYILLDDIKDNSDAIEIMGLEKCYVNNVFQYKDNYYYFKDGNMYFTYMFNELLGEALSRELELDSVKYLLAKYNHSIGIVSKNFRDIEYFEYYYINELNPMIITGADGFDTINFLKTMCTDDNNQECLLDNIFKLLSIDTYMLQCDRHLYNLQFKIDRKTGYFDLAPIYDFGFCNDPLGDKYFRLSHIIMNLSFDNLIPLRKKYPLFGDVLKQISEIDIVEQIESIALKYHFNMDCSQFQNVLDYYEIKKNDQKNYMKKIFN